MLALRGTLEETLRSVALCEAREKRKELAAHTFELGRAVYVGASAFGTGGRDAWEEGEAELSLRRRQAALLSRREQLEKAGRERCNRKRRDATQRKKKGQLLAAEDDQKVSSSSSSSSSSSETAITASCGASSNKEETTASSSQHWTFFGRPASRRKDSRSVICLAQRISVRLRFSKKDARARGLSDDIYILEDTNESSVSHEVAR